MNRLFATLPTTILLFILPLTCSAEGLVADFEAGRLGQRWSAIREITAARVVGPEADKTKLGESALPLLPAGKALEVSTAGNAGLFSRNGAFEVTWLTTTQFGFWVYRSGEEKQKHPVSTMEVQFYEPDGKTKFWRKIELAHEGWKLIVVDMKWCRRGAGRIADWSKVKRFGFWFRDAANITIDTIQSGKTRMYATRIGATDIEKLARGKDLRALRQVGTTKHVRLMTNASQLDPKKLTEHLTAVAEKITADFAFLPPPDQPGVLVVFEDVNQYREFPPRLAQALAAKIGRPSSGGFTVRSIATSYWLEKHGTLRPVYTHEFAHSLLSRMTRMGNKGEWLNEGLAVKYQLEFHPQESIGKIIRQGVSDPRYREPLSKLCDGSTISTTRYWQAYSLIEFFSQSEKYSKQWPVMVRQMSASGSANVTPYVETLLQSDWKTIEQDWRAYCDKRWP